MAPPRRFVNNTHCNYSTELYLFCPHQPDIAQRLHTVKAQYNKGVTIYQEDYYTSDQALSDHQSINHTAIVHYE